MFREFYYNEMNNEKSMINESPFETYIVEKGESIYSIARKLGVDYKEVMLLNGLGEDDYIYPNQEIIILKRDYDLYITRDNDTLGLVSKKINIPVDSIVRYNANIYLVPNQLIVYKKEKYN